MKNKISVSARALVAASVIAGAAVSASAQGIQPTNYVDVGAGFTLLNGYVIAGSGFAIAAVTTLLGILAYRKWGGKAIGGR